MEKQLQVWALLLYVFLHNASARPRERGGEDAMSVHFFFVHYIYGNGLG